MTTNIVAVRTISFLAYFNLSGLGMQETQYNVQSCVNIVTEAIQYFSVSSQYVQDMTDYVEWPAQLC
jgi:hypothetical protein